jgi:hypothetical protein
MPNYRFKGTTTKAFKHAGETYQVKPGETVFLKTPIDSPELELADEVVVEVMVEPDYEDLSVESEPDEEEE